MEQGERPFPGCVPAIYDRTMRLGPCVVLLLAACSSSSNASGPKAPDAGAPLGPLGLNDVSVLFPLPRGPLAAGALGPEDAGERGALLPRSLFDKVPPFRPSPPADALDFARMRVVAARFDGCFPKSSGCEAQIRLVMQPIDDDGTARDSALHLFYHLDDADLAAVVAELRRLRTLAPEVHDAPLDVHAGLAAQGLDGAYGKGLRDLLLKYAGESNLTRMTFLLRSPAPGEEWFFGGFGLVGGRFVVLNVTGVGTGEQRVNRVTNDGWGYDLNPSPTVPEDIGLLLSSDKAKAATDEERGAALAALGRIENPEKYGPDKIACANCHVTTYVAEGMRRTFGLDVTATADAFHSARDLTRRGSAADNVSSLRAFGYYGTTAMISDRVVHDTAATVDDLERRFPLPATP